MAAGGFIVTATVYIFKLERFHSIVRPAVLTAFLGYLAVAVGLLFDLGLPWNIWHMIVYWNPRSPLFEVGWCVMLYLTVLALGIFSGSGRRVPAPCQASAQRSIKARLPLVIVGIGLSTLHQSSLGSLFLIMPYRLHPLWYSPILPVHVPDLRDWARTLDGDVREPSDGVPLPPQARDGATGVIWWRVPLGVD